MLRKSGFEGVLVDHKIVVRDELPRLRVVIEHVSMGESQYFLESLESAVQIHTLQNSFTSPVFWKSLVINSSDFTRNIFDVNFNDIEFTAELAQIGISHTIKKGIDCFKYKLSFDMDCAKAKELPELKFFVKRKEKDENGKARIVKYPVTVVMPEESSDNPLTK
jgi:hypothetical protein